VQEIRVKLLAEYDYKLVDLLAADRCLLISHTVIEGGAMVVLFSVVSVCGCLFVKIKTV